MTQATQYAFTQADRSISSIDSFTSIETLTDFIYEALERAKGKFDVNLLKDINDSEISIIVTDLGKKLSHKGIYNMCHSICAMQIELSERFIGFVCKDLLLTVVSEKFQILGFRYPKIIVIRYKNYFSGNIQRRAFEITERSDCGMCGKVSR